MFDWRPRTVEQRVDGRRRKYVYRRRCQRRYDPYGLDILIISLDHQSPISQVQRRTTGDWPGRKPQSLCNIVDAPAEIVRPSPS